MFCIYGCIFTVRHWSSKRDPGAGVQAQGPGCLADIVAGHAKVRIVFGIGDPQEPVFAGELFSLGQALGEGGLVQREYMHKIEVGALAVKLESEPVAGAVFGRVDNVGAGALGYMQFFEHVFSVKTFRTGCRCVLFYAG